MNQVKSSLSSSRGTVWIGIGYYNYIALSSKYYLISNFWFLLSSESFFMKLSRYSYNFVLIISAVFNFGPFSILYEYAVLTI